LVIAVLSDTHRTSLDSRFTDRVEELAREADHIFHLGDMVARDILDFLNSFPLTAVAGNMDCPEIKASQPIKRIVELEGYRFGLIHGWGGPFGLDDRVLKEMPGLDCVCFGHTHRPVNERRGRTLLFNPGSAQNDSRSKSMYGLLKIGPDGISGRHLPF